MNNYKHMYNYSFKTTYNRFVRKFLKDDQYRKDLLNAFSLQSYECETIMKIQDSLFNTFKDNPQLRTLLNEYIANQRTFPMKISDKTAFMFLFSFENFHYLHKCLGYLLENKPIDEAYFNTFINSFKNNSK